MVVRDLNSRYSGSLLGIFWSVIPPLAQVVTYTFIYTYAFGARLPAGEGTTVFAVCFMCVMNNKIMSGTLLVLLSLLVGIASAQEELKPLVLGSNKRLSLKVENVP